MKYETGIIASQNIVSQPFTRRMKTGSPWMDDQTDVTACLTRAQVAALRSSPGVSGVARSRNV